MPTEKLENNQLKRKRLITEYEAEAEYGFKVKTLRKWRFFNKGPRACKFGRSVLYDVRDIERWIESRPAVGEEVEAVR